MKILCIGDIVGKPGRQAVQKILPDLRKEKDIDFVIANGENLAHGKGMSTRTVQAMRDFGVDFFTGGNHSFAKKDYYDSLNDKNIPVIRPANYPEGVPGDGSRIVETKQGKILIINLMGQTFMAGNLRNPLTVTEEILKKHKRKKFEAIIVDFHAEATSEKYTFRNYFDERLTCIFGTHTHVPTADAHITESGMGYITDIGMCGAVNSSVSIKSDLIVERIMTQLPNKNELETRYPYYFRAILIESEKGKCKNIELIQKKIEN